ncbi:Metallo-hydrolase/oxidoreductase [Eremomyces bilateralis CBS 781.70]|uniref:Metallo-hydrolase/oxidoreductase n=1 Tax=Eremomyces bilateralis CBS 781.70 TaxID=1392243 RepID=A0A6G1GGP7_9PEZI|nr:Metallo-hydrolase/oxidoreductase [Eremomyces bilateralis CBS 781.70]KAF1817106.1 Metallo-hydrolase/oxidoreductase [Eremomyces bilateralis CBS 781.70]
MREPTTCFVAERLNSTTFKIVEEDQYLEYPQVFVKILDETLVIVDTGCGGAAKGPDVALTSLREYLETVPLADNGKELLNPGARLSYTVVCTHCHFDHIGTSLLSIEDGVWGVEQFGDHPKSLICASSYDRSFLSPANLSRNSLCENIGIRTPLYKVSHWLGDGQFLQHNSHSLPLQVFHTPGHTPDELAAWDPDERVLFIGDSFYEWVPIIFPSHGNMIRFSDSIGKMKQLIAGWNADESSSRVKIACGHVTYCADGEAILNDVDEFLWLVVTGAVKPKQSEESRGEIFDLYEGDGGKYSIRCPRRLVVDFRADEEAMTKLKRRNGLIL